MDENEIVESLSESRAPRATLYLSTSKVDDVYTQSVSRITQVVSSTGRRDKLSASLLKIIGAEVSEETLLTAKAVLTPVLKAILVESAARTSQQLVNLACAPPRKGVLLQHVGEARITLMGDPVSSEETSLPHETCRLVEAERQRQEKLLRFRNDQARTIVWTTETAGRAYASIASTEGVDIDFLASYAPNPPFGILGRLEKESDAVTFISPVWIWHEGW